MDAAELDAVRTLLIGATPAVLTTTRAAGSAATSPVWFHWSGDAFELVVVEGDPKLSHLRRDPRCALVVFEAVPPFRGVEVRGDAELLTAGVADVRRAIADRYLGGELARRFLDARASVPGVRVRLPADRARTWDLRGILPT
jgi:PPOX class probable F420-dependent enzyme